MIARELRDQLSDGRLRSGSVLPTESQLAAAYLVSRQSARIALRRLAADGLVVRVPGRGTLAAPFGHEAIPAYLTRDENR
jgi:GntR family transcriptional regulator